MKKNNVKKLSQLKAAAYNPRTISKNDLKGLKYSLEEFGDISGITFNQRTGNLVTGHQRVRAIREKYGELILSDKNTFITEDGKEFNVRFVDWDIAKEKAANIAANAETIQGEFTSDVSLFLEEVNINSPEAYSSLLLSELNIPELNLPINEDNFDVEKELEEIQNPKSKPGDVYQLGAHRLMCGDSTKKNDFKKLLADNKINTAFTSPPYAMQRKNDYGGIKTVDYPKWMLNVAENVKEVLNENGSFFINIKEHAEQGAKSLYVFKTIIALCEHGHWNLKDTLIWNKPGIPGDYKDRLKDGFEWAFWFSKNDNIDYVLEYIDDEEITELTHDTFSKIIHLSKKKKIKFKPTAVGKKGITFSGGGSNKNKFTGNVGINHENKRIGIIRPSNVIKLQCNQEREKHPAMFPVALPEFFIKLTTDEGDSILDPFLGSGTTLIACEQTNRVCYGMELDPKYCDVIVRRYLKFKQQKTVIKNNKEVEF